MDEVSTTKILCRALKKTKEHHEIGNQRIRAYYDNSYEPLEDFPEPEMAPHDSIMNEGVELINLAHDTMSAKSNNVGDREIDAELILYGVGIERLLTGIFLKLKPKEFVRQLEDRGESPSFETARSLVVSDFATRTNGDAVGNLNLILDIVQVHRNNEVHLGYHQYIYEDLSPAILGIAYGLGHLYIDEKQDSWNQLGEKLSNYFDS
jgi:hypothetical protein